MKFLTLKTSFFLFSRGQFLLLLFFSKINYDFLTGIVKSKWSQYTTPLFSFDWQVKNLLDLIKKKNEKKEKKGKERKLVNFKFFNVNLLSQESSLLYRKSYYILLLFNIFTFC